jgi:hypothetical protein
MILPLLHIYTHLLSFGHANLIYYFSIIKLYIIILFNLDLVLHVRLHIYER